MMLAASCTAFRFSTLARRPGLRDKVVLAPGLIEKNGLKQGVVAKVIADETKKDPCTPYRLELPGTMDRPWFSADDIILEDPVAEQPEPEPPASHECCGSSCPNCVWIQHWEACNEWEASKKLRN